jgi:hypothetical protein
MALALHSTPRGQRLDRDPFLGRVLEEVGEHGIMVTFNPALIRPAVLQIQQLQPLARMLLRQQRDSWMAQIPPEALAAIEAQLRTELGVRDLAELAEYVEGILTVTLEQGLAFATNELIAFEGLSFTADLDPGFPKASLRLYSSRFQPDAAAAPVPLDEVRETLRWLGEGSGRFAVTGRKPKRAASPVISAWTARVRTELAGRGLQSKFFDELAKLLRKRTSLGTHRIAQRLDLDRSSSVDAADATRGRGQLERVFFPVAVADPSRGRVLPEGDLDLFESWLNDQVTARNVNRELGLEFARSFSNYQPWFDVENRFKSNSPDTDFSPIRRYVTETAILSRGGLFGYDQHEFISRRIWSARALPGGLVFHQGRGEPIWLANLNGQVRRTAPAGDRQASQPGAGWSESRANPSFLAAFADGSWMVGVFGSADTCRSHSLPRGLPSHLAQRRPGIRATPADGVHSDARSIVCIKSGSGN